MFDELNPAAGAGGDGGVSPAPTDSGVSGPPPDGSVAGSPPAGLNWETAPQQFRDGHQRLQTEYQQTKQGLDRWNQLGQYDDIQRIHQAYNGLQSEASQLGQYLGFDPREISDTFRQDPAGTVAVLRQMVKKAQETGQPPTAQDVNSLVQRGIDQAMRPFKEQQEARLDKEAETRFDGQLAPYIKTAFPHGLPDSWNQAMEGLAWQLVIDNQDMYNPLRNQGMVNGLKPAFDQAKTTLLKLYTDMQEFEKKRIAGGQPQAQPPSNGQPKKLQTIDDVLARIADKNIPDDAIFGR